MTAWVPDPVPDPADQEAASRDLLDWGRDANTAVNRVRWRTEQTIANLKTWRILHTDYQGPFDTFATTIAAVLGLEFSVWPVNKPPCLVGVPSSTRSRAGRGVVQRKTGNYAAYDHVHRRPPERSRNDSRPA